MIITILKTSIRNTMYLYHMPQKIKMMLYDLLPMNYNGTDSKSGMMSSR